MRHQIVCHGFHHLVWDLLADQFSLFVKLLCCAPHRHSRWLCAAAHLEAVSLAFFTFKRGMSVPRVIGTRCVTVWLLMFRLLSCVNEFDAKVKSEFFTGKPQSSLPFLKQWSERCPL